MAVAGTHGKSTTTSMTGAILEADGRDPTVIVGGRIRGQPGNVRIGGGAWVVAEADEFDRSFLALEPIHAVITNLEADHLDTYRDMDDVRAAFAAFANLVPVGGTLVLNAEDPELGILPRPAGRRVVTFGLVEGADARAEHIVADRLETRFTLVLDRENVGQITLRMPGLHNVRNALAAAALGWSLAVAPTAIREGLAVVRGVERRFDIVHEDEEVIIVDDYAHHPTEVRATLTSARAGWPERRLVAVFQPHLYTRTRDFAAGFGDALSIADVVFVTDVYPAREAPIEGVDGRMVSAATRRASDTEVHDTPGVDVAAAVAPSIRSGDLVITLGAGDIDRVAHTLAAELRHEKGRRA